MKNESQAEIMVWVQPNAKKDEVTGFENGVLRMKISAPPVKGKANKRLVGFLSDVLKVRKTDIRVEKGVTSKLKKVVVDNLTQEQLLQKLGKS